MRFGTRDGVIFNIYSYILWSLNIRCQTITYYQPNLLPILFVNCGLCKIMWFSFNYYSHFLDSSKFIRSPRWKALEKPNVIVVMNWCCFLPCKNRQLGLKVRVLGSLAKLLHKLSHLLCFTYVLFMVMIFFLIHYFVKFLFL
jgi:hypothetical protein